MPQSLAQILVHLIFSTKDRDPALTPALRAELYPYLAAVLREHGCPCLRVGGARDHVHLLFALSGTLPLARVVELVKTASSKWLKTKDPSLAKFRWQGGYGAFSVSPSATEKVIRYIDDQEEHHRRVTFQEELRTFLVRYGIDYDERYLWD